MSRILGYVPRILSSKPHILVLFLLGVYLVVLPLLGVHVSQGAELTGGNYTNVTSDLGACIAAGGTVHLVKKHAEQARAIQDLHGKVDALSPSELPEPSAGPSGKAEPSCSPGRPGS